MSSCQDGVFRGRDHPSVASPPRSQPLLRFPGATREGARDAGSYLGMTGDPYPGRPRNGWGALSRTVKFRHSACGGPRRAQGWWHVLTVRSGV
ncbi:hypothetical protein DD630_13560 [Streptomyces sp. BSE7F]|nr:hypothetical protein DD630_13560 [Streptomyces sp. BSE7F]